eukprot:g7887.t1
MQPQTPQWLAIENAGLDGVMTDLNREYEDQANGMYKMCGRADFFQYAGLHALKLASKDAEKIGTGRELKFPFKWGRVDCCEDCAPEDTCSNCQGGGMGKSFSTRLPQPHHLWEEYSLVMKKLANYTTRDIVCLMGAHTLGEVHKRQYGGLEFDAGWLPQHKRHIFHNHYYKQLKQNNWFRTHLDSDDAPPEQWDGCFSKSNMTGHPECLQMVKVGDLSRSGHVNLCEDKTDMVSYLRTDLELGWSTKGNKCHVFFQCPPRLNPKGKLGDGLMYIFELAESAEKFAECFENVFYRLSFLGHDEKDLYEPRPN